MAGLVHLAEGAVLGGDFRLLAQLGRGGMGIVYLAEQLSTGKQRAVKVMNTLPVEGDKQRERFEQEARVGARIASDHVVEVIGAGVDDATGMPWLAMELLEGEDLEDLVDRRGAIDEPEVAAIFEQLCHALGAAHEAGIVHRDIKPQNVFLSQTRTPQAPTAIKVLDFGIAKVAASGKTTSTALVGSPAWMAPEQTEAKARITPAADVWALGLLAFWLLTGRAYWLSAEDGSSSVHALLREVLFEPIAPPSARAAELGCDEPLRAGFDDWFAHCVTRKPADRFANASKAGEAFARLLAGEQNVEEQTRAPDLALMSTRDVSEALKLGMATSADAAEENSGTPGASSDSADPHAEPTAGGGEPDRQPEAAAEAAAVERAKPAVHATALTPTGLESALESDDAGASKRAPSEQAAERPGRRPATTWALVVAALVVAFTAGAFLFSARSDTRRKAARTRITASAAEPGPSAKERPLGGATAKRRDPPRRAGFAGIDLSDFDPSAHMRTAQRAAREQIPDAELVMFSAFGVQGNGRMDVSTTKHTAQWLFRSKAGDECVLLLVTHAGVTVQKTKGPSCIGPNIGLPRCTLREIVDKLMGGGSVRVLTVEAGHLTYLGDQKRPGVRVWNGQVGPLAMTNLPDDCAKDAGAP